MNAHTPNQIRPFALGPGRPLSGIVQEMIAKEMLSQTPQWARAKPWMMASKNGAAVSAAIASRATRRKASAEEVAALRKSGMSMAQIAKQCSFARRTVRRILDEAGIA